MPFCRPPTYYPRALIRIHHYLGSWEAYSFRQDRRKGGDKNRQVWEEQAAVQGECCSLLNTYMSIVMNLNLDLVVSFCWLVNSPQRRVVLAMRDHVQMGALPTR
jgi:hypothetical protein